ALSPAWYLRQWPPSWLKVRGVRNSAGGGTVRSSPRRRSASAWPSLRQTAASSVMDRLSKADSSARGPDLAKFTGLQERGEVAEDVDVGQDGEGGLDGGDPPPFCRATV
ncbi:hypothetical protein THAOC_25298, partial [Thalassiosira oceanica]